MAFNKPNVQAIKSATSFTPTEEQVAIVTMAKQGTNIAIEAFAGSSKTTTCVLIAEALPVNSLYISFNKSIADEAKTKFPSWVTCQTLHSLAWKAVIKYSKSPLGQKLQGNFNLVDIELPYPLPKDLVLKEKLKVTKAIKDFCQSGDLYIHEFLKRTMIDDLLEGETPNMDLIELINDFWLDCVNSHSSTKITHDVYLKLYQQSNPKLDFSMIYLDELQDSNPITLAIFLAQMEFGTQLIGVGDPYQAIYEWRGAIDAFKLLPDTFTRLYLTESFRFTQEIANMAYKLTSIAGNSRRITGKKVMSDSFNTAQEVIIVRNNSTGLSYILEAAKKGQTIYAQMDLTDLWSKLYHISSLMYRQPIKYPNRELSQYSTFAELREVGEEVTEIKKFIRLTTQLSDGGLTANINQIKNCMVKDEANANIVITTAHKSKGLEWDRVTLAYDMFYTKEDQEINEALAENQTLNLLYVALTRARYEVKLPELVEEVISNYTYYRI